MADLLIYNKLHPGSLAAVYTYHKKNGAGYTLLDLSGKTTANVQTAVAALTDDSFDNAYVFVPTSEAGTTFSGTAGAMMLDHLAHLEWKMKTAKRGEELIGGVCDTNSTVTNVVLTGDTIDEDDAYNNKYVLLTVTSGGAQLAARNITDYATTGKICTVRTTTTPASTTHTFSVIEPSEYVYLLGDTTVAGKKVARQAWEKIYPNNDFPIFLLWIDAPYGCVFDAGTLQSYTSGTKTAVLQATNGDAGSLAGANRTTNDYFNDMYLYIYSATTGAHQYQKITDYTGSTTLAAVLENDFSVALAGTLVYRIVRYADQAYKDAAARLYILTKLNDATSGANHLTFSNLIDKTNVLNTLGKFGSSPDYTAFEEMFEEGNLIHEALAKGITSIITTS
jgi:hypothetical protein